MVKRFETGKCSCKRWETGVKGDVGYNCRCNCEKSGGALEAIHFKMLRVD